MHFVRQPNPVKSGATGCTCSLPWNGYAPDATSRISRWIWATPRRRRPLTCSARRWAAHPRPGEGV